MARDRLHVIEESLSVGTSVLRAMAVDHTFVAGLATVADVWTTSLKGGGKIMLAGNGGSAADAQHVAGELVNRFNFDRPAIAGLALSTDTSVLTCIGNDSSFNDVFARQIEALGRPGDVFCAISTSGNSPNILRAIDAAKRCGVIVVGFTGKDGGAMASLCDYLVSIPHTATPRVQEGHLASYHAICSIVEAELFAPPDRVKEDASVNV
jgi:D-sedoheptulose 7-phosphate isomerase